MNPHRFTFSALRRSAGLLAEIAPWLLSATLLLTAIAKIYTLDHFHELVMSFTFLSERLRYWITFGVPLAEIVVSTLLLIPATRALGLVLSLTILTVFTGYLVRIVADPYAPACLCLGLVHFAKNAHRENQISLVRNCVLLFVVIVALIMRLTHNPKGGTLTHS
jgi:hypothetical protein